MRWRKITEWLQCCEQTNLWDRDLLNKSLLLNAIEPEYVPWKILKHLNKEDHASNLISNQCLASCMPVNHHANSWLMIAWSTSSSSNITAVILWMQVV